MCLIYPAYFPNISNYLVFVNNKIFVLKYKIVTKNKHLEIDATFTLQMEN